MSANWRHGWFLDRAPLVKAQSIGGFGSAGKYYFEVTLTSTSGFGSGSACFGICNSSANLPRIVDAAVNVAQAQTAGAIVIAAAPDGGSNAWGYPTKLDLIGPGTWTLNQVMGVAVDTVNKLLWVKNISAGTAWKGNGGPLSDPSTGADGADFATANHPVTGNIYAFVGAGDGDGLSGGGARVNFGATAFTGALPTGYAAWGATDTLNPDDNSNLTLSGGNLIATALREIAGTNVPQAIVRSRGKKAQP
jgi:hypothetical protein